MQLSHRGAMRVAMAIGAVFIVVGFGFATADLAWPLWRAHGARTWTETTCFITDSGLAHGRRTTRAVVEYRYQAGGRTFTGDRVGFQPLGSSSRPNAAIALVDRLQPGTTTPCWYDPDQPDDAVLDRTIRPRLFGLAGALAVVIGFLVLRFGARRVDDQSPGTRTPDGLVTHVRRGASTAELVAATAIAVTAGWIAAWALVLDVELVAPLAALLAGAAVATLLGLIRGRLTVVTMTLPAAVRAGDPLTVRWQVTTPLATPRVSVRAVARESAQHERRGWWGRSVSYEQRWTPRADLELRADGDDRATARLPDDAPASTRSDAHSVDWTVDLRVHLPAGRDLTVRAPLELRAAG